MARRRGQTGRLGDMIRDTLGLSKQTERPTAPSSLGGISYTWDMASDEILWGPNGTDVLGSDICLPATGEAFARMVEPGGGQDRKDAILSPNANLPHPFAYKARYALRLGADCVWMVDDAGRWSADDRGRPALAHGIMRVRADVSANAHCATVQARSDLLTRMRDEAGIGEGSRRRSTLIVGHLAQDDETETLMGEVGRAIRPLLRRGDMFIRYASTRFALLLSSCSREDAESAMRRLVQLIEANSYVLAEHLRLGAASTPDHAADAVALLGRAEAALALATENAQRFALYHDQGSKPLACGTDALEVVQSLNDRRLAFSALPILDALTRNVMFREVSPRLVMADGAVAPATDIAAVMERDGLSLLLDGRMLERVAEHLAASPKDRLALPIAASTLHHEDWLDMLAACLGRFPGIASRLMIALPAHAMHDVGAIRGKLDTMKALGVGLMAQGFGTGDIGCSQLRNLPLDLLKIDGPFIQTLGRSTEERLFLRTLIDIARQFGMAIVADWVEDDPTARMLATWGVDYLQGGLFGEETILGITTTRREARRA